MTVTVHRSAHREVVEAEDAARYEGVQMAIRALRAKADEQSQQGSRLGAHMALWGADYIERALAATVEGTPP